ncbi:polysaccharide deacetylase family protein [Stieleria sp. JC731]|uniref:polysaccharide deacetylase family protein n=1 Tax=Pirellulaceae TaxID=2691357 RepID=UPI001E4AE3A4|nr:polysaccharide deacetylase family protein [Stieleria sp. JC731]MCC9600509.1 polysaccharide deacetylase family protein [Stieleria sp. JC731]
MLDTRQFGLHAYYAGTSWLRKHYRGKLEQEGRAPMCVLFYHRVADQHPNPWTISRAEFERQMRWVSENLEVVSLQEVQRKIGLAENHRTTATVTFDDGYAENVEFAIPLLLEMGIPTTYFVTLDFVTQNTPFPHDVQRGVPLPINTVEQIRWMAEQGVEIGAHTRSHCDVGSITDPEELADEILTATEELARMIDRPIRYFAFPYGKPENMTRAAVELLRQAGMEGVCSAYGAYNFCGNDPFHIQRIHGDPDFIRFKNWMTVDPRKVSVGLDFQFRDSQS